MISNFDNNAGDDQAFWKIKPATIKISKQSVALFMYSMFSFPTQYHLKEASYIQGE